MRHLSTTWFIAAGSALLLTLSTGWYDHKLDQTGSNLTMQTMLLEKLSAGSRLVVSNAYRLLDDSNLLSALHKQHDQNMVWYQSLSKGNLKESLPPLSNIPTEQIDALDLQFDRYSNQVMELVQGRSTLTNLQESRDTTLLAAHDLSQSANALLQGLQQIAATPQQLADLYALSMALNNHYVNVLTALDNQTRYNPLDLDWINNILKALSSGEHAAKSSIIRRSASQLLADVTAFQKDHSAAIGQHHGLRSTMLDQIRKLETTTTELTTTLEQIESSANRQRLGQWITSIGLWLTTLLSLMAVTALALREPKHDNVAKPRVTATPLPQPASETTTSHLVSQLKMDKNKLMNDIRPLGEGILYIRADEHLESTGDLARCFNQSREALIQRIESLRGNLLQLTEEMSQGSTSNGSSPTISIDTTPVENLTYRAQAELEGLARTIKSQLEAGAELKQDMLLACKRADRLLDEIRIRVRKGIQEAIRDSVNIAEAQQLQPGNESIRQLIARLTANLDQFQTQAPSRNKRRSPN